MATNPHTVKKFVAPGQDFENCMGQMGKWYILFHFQGAILKNDPTKKKLLAAGSVEEEALVLLYKRRKLLNKKKS